MHVNLLVFSTKYYFFAIADFGVETVLDCFVCFSRSFPSVAKELNAWAYMYRIINLNQVALSAGLLTPLRYATMLYAPAIVLVIPFMILFLLSFTRCGGYKAFLQSVAVLGVSVTANLSYAFAIVLGRALYEHNWLNAVQYISLGLVGTVAMEVDRLNSVSADEAARNLRKGFTGHLADATCSDEADGLRILEQLRRSGHETLGQNSQLGNMFLCV